MHVIYIPGLGDERIAGQTAAINTWKHWGVEPEVFQMHWSDKEPWEDKFERLLARIDALLTKNQAVALVGASAGGAAVINAYTARKDSIIGCVLIAGKVNRPNAIGARYRRQNPAFVTAAYNCEEALRKLSIKDRQRILSRYALADETVYKPDSKIPGAHNQVVPSIGHALTIATQITIGAPSFLGFLKSRIKSGSET